MALSLTNQVTRIKPLYDYLKKQQENYRFIRIVEVSATFVLISFFLLFAIRPTVLTISSLWGDIQSKQILKKQLTAKIDDIIIAQNLFSQVQEKYRIIDSSLPDRPHFSETAQQIQQTGNNSGLTINTFSYDLQNDVKQQISPNVKSYHISLSVNGPFSSNSKLISDLLQNRRLIGINSVNIGLSNPPVIGTSVGTPTGNIITSFISDYYYWDPNP